jgi:hypothetical protein
LQKQIRLKAQKGAIRDALKEKSKAKREYEDVEKALRGKGAKYKADLESNIAKANDKNEKLNKLRPVAKVAPTVGVGAGAVGGAGIYAYKSKSKKNNMNKNAFEILEEALEKEAVKEVSIWGL